MTNFPVVVGHRGWPKRFPDNTLAGFLAASGVADAVELDVRRSADGKLVLSHDAVLQGHLVSETTWSILADLDLGGGHKPALLDEVLVAVSECPVQMEIKNIPFEPGYEPDHRLALEAAERSKPGDMVTSFNPATIGAVKSVFPDVPTGLALEPIISLDDAVKICVEGGHVGLIPRESMIDRPLELPDEIEVFPWTVNNTERALELAEFGVSGIITDDPELIRGHFEEDH